MSKKSEAWGWYVLDNLTWHYPLTKREWLLKSLFGVIVIFSFQFPKKITVFIKWGVLFSIMYGKGIWYVVVVVGCMIGNGWSLVTLFVLISHRAMPWGLFCSTLCSSSCFFEGVNWFVLVYNILSCQIIYSILTRSSIKILDPFLVSFCIFRWFINFVNYNVLCPFYFILIIDNLFFPGDFNCLFDALSVVTVSRWFGYWYLLQCCILAWLL